MGQLLEALKQIEDRSPLPRPVKPVAVEELATMDHSAASDRRARVESENQPTPIDPRYRELLGTILSQMALGNEMALLVAGFAADEARGGQLAAMYPLLARQVEGGLLVVDADSRHASLGERFDFPHEHGLADVLAGRVRWQDVVRAARHAGLYLLPGSPRSTGQVPFRPNDLSSLLPELRQAHRLVIVDTVLSTTQEIAGWAAICDAVLLTLRLGVTPRRQVRHAIDAIQARNGSVLGCVLLEP
ncbi:MAG: hypothetical protein JW888_17795 [Pirellulales bacterium]|nr:hypothetical protein [Pirellulales bacterium]